MPFFKAKQGEGQIDNLGHSFNETEPTEVLDEDIAERLRKHPQFEEVSESTSVPRETQAEIQGNAFDPAPVAEGTNKKRRQHKVADVPNA